MATDLNPPPPTGRFCRWIATIWIALLVCSQTGVAAEKEPLRCEVCGNAFGATIYTRVDQVTREKIWFCDDCLNQVNDCFTCGLPVPENSFRLSDGRHYCKRDGAEALVDPGAIQATVTETIQNLHLAVGRYMTFPSDNVDMSVMDRVNIQTMRTTPGADFSCPNLQGLYQTITNEAGQRTHSIQILSGLDIGNTRSVVAHELTHAWIADNVPEERRFGGDAEEGFCELIAFLVADQLGDQRAKDRIAENGYTRGQFDLFLEAKKRYELQTILDWVHHGEQSRIDPTDIDQVRRVTIPVKNPARLWVNYATVEQLEKDPAKSGTERQLELKGIVGNGARRLALISGKSFASGEKGKVEIAGVKTEIQCVEIGQDFVRVKIVESGEEKRLTLATE